MGTYSYKLHKSGKVPENIQKHVYTNVQLSRLTTYQLREICIKEKLVKYRLNELNREALIHLIMTFRGANETPLIKQFAEEGILRVETLLQQTQNHVTRIHTLRAPSKLSIYEDLNVTVHDNYKILANQILNEGNILLVDENYHVTTIFNLIHVGETFYLIKDKSIPINKMGNGKYFLLYFEAKDSEILYDFYYNQYHLKPTTLHFYELPILECRVCQAQMAQEELVIDFGTCNTTLGTYEDTTGLQAVEIIDCTQEHLKMTSLIPSVIGVKTIENEEIEYVFGYEALALAQSNYVKEGIHIFYDIKRWVSDYEREECITSESGQHRWVKRKVLLKAYFEYIIELANAYFKVNFNSLRFLAPIRQKKKFEQLFNEILCHYNVMTSLDEGNAVLFDTISEVIKKEKYIPGQAYKALIMDCGGGTTDLTACTFRIENKKMAYHMSMETSYENGDTNFGGNNLTYRLMQFLKLIIAGQFDQSLSMSLLFEEDEEFAYDKFEALYNKAEAVLPTCFKTYENASVNEYFKVKQNFYYLFYVAEEIKQQFFKQGPLYEMTLTLAQNEKSDRRQAYMFLDKWKLCIYADGKLIPLLKLEPISIYRYEIYQLLRGDIYQLVEKLLLPFYNTRELMNYQIIKLTGQSCQVELFKEALKEFIPGKLLSYKKEGKEQEILKLGCLYGAIKYYRNIKLGIMEVDKTYAGTAFPYEVSSYTHQGKEKTLIHSLQRNKETGFISRFRDGDTLKLYLKNAEATVLREYTYTYKITDFKETTYYEVEEAYSGRIAQSDTDNIENEEIKFFVWVDEELWGFYVLPILRQHEVLYYGKLSFFDFENDTWEENFFDGNK